MLNNPTTSRKKQFPCVCAAGLGERRTEGIPCKLRDDHKGRRAIRAAFDDAGRWLIQWRESDGEEWVGTYRLLPV